MDEAPHRERTDEPESPEHEKHQRNCPQHVFAPLEESE
jgi:hypothetical protein